MPSTDAFGASPSETTMTRPSLLLPVLAFLRGHTPNRDGWIANPASDPRGAERAAWAVSTAGGEPWRLVEAR